MKKAQNIICVRTFKYGEMRNTNISCIQIAQIENYIYTNRIPFKNIAVNEYLLNYTYVDTSICSKYTPDACYTSHATML